MMLSCSGSNVLDKSENGPRIFDQSSYEYEEDDVEWHIYAQTKEQAKEELVH